MTTHPRMPALAMLVFAFGIGAAALAATGQFHRGAAGSIPELEARIAGGKANADTFAAYGDALRADKRFREAAVAYTRAIQLDPEKKSFRFSATLALGEAGDADNFFDAIVHLSATDPKAAVDVMERPELSSLHTDARWTPALRSAHAQAAD